MPADSVDLVVTSPPFLALRSYLPADHPDKGKEIGSEATPGAFIDVLLDVVEELDRVLAPHGSICIELGDTYAGSGGAGGDYNADGLRDGQPAFNGSASRSGWHRMGARSTQPDQPPNYRKAGTVSDSGTRSGGDGWPETKSLTLIPELYRMALAYGVNPLTGRTTPRWRIRNVIRWVRPNPPVGALGDKFRPGTSEMVVATGIDEAGRTRYFDLDAVRTPGASHDREGEQKGRISAARDVPEQSGSAWMDGKPLVHNPAGAPPLDWWEIPTKGYAG